MHHQERTRTPATAQFRECFGDIYETLYKMVRTGNRRLGAIEETGVVGINVRFYSEPLPDPAMHPSHEGN